MRSIESRLFAAISSSLVVAQLLLPSPLAAAAHPRYGGTLRVELQAATVTLDPRACEAGSLESATNEKLDALVFERLAALDNYGRFQPVLATDWSHDAANKRWQFAIRTGVKFSDGSTLAPPDIVAALQALLPESLKVYTAGNSVVIQSATPVPDLLEQLASGCYFIFAVTPDKALLGTGPFVAREASGHAGPGKEKNPNAPQSANPTAAVHSSGSHMFFQANEEAWSGRPFVDGIDVTLGVPPLRAMFDLQLGKADLVELSPDLVPRARQADLRVWISDPVTLYGLRFDDAQAAASDVRLREALSLSLDRGTMANVLLQRQAEPAAALLPQWLSGYAFLFNVGTNLDRAKELRRSLPPNAAGGAVPLRLRVDRSGDLAKLLGERVAVNARQASILVQVIAHAVTRPGAASPIPSDPPSGVHLFAWHYSSLSPRTELESMFAAYNLTEPPEVDATSTDHERLYARERRVLEDRRVLPLILQAEAVGLGSSVRDWMPAPWGEWHLADVWLDLSEPAVADSSNPAITTAPSPPQPRATAPGAKP
jgi:peptide/nickel transport system substrate-binding protein